jgi:hypothetical protein
MMLLAAAIGLFLTLVYPLYDVDVKLHLPRIKESAAQKAESADISADILDYCIPTEDYLFRPFTFLDVSADVMQVKAAPAKKEEKVTAENVPATLDYAIVTEKNLFHPERKMPSEKKVEQEIVRPEIIFYGAVITDDKKIAYVEDKKNPYTTPGRGKRQTPLAQGAMIGGYKLTEVNSENIVLVRGDDKMVVNLRDQKDRTGTGTTTGKQSASAMTKLKTPSWPQMTSGPQLPSDAQMLPRPQAPPAGQPFNPSLTIPRGGGPAPPMTHGR